MDRKFGYEYNKKYMEDYMKTLEEIKVRVPKGKKDVIRAVATQQGMSMSSYIKTAVKEKIKADTGEDIEL